MTQAAKARTVTIHHRFDELLTEAMSKTGLTRSRLVDQGLRYLFGSEDGNRWLEAQATAERKAVASRNKLFVG